WHARTPSGCKRRRRFSHARSLSGTRALAGDPLTPLCVCVCVCLWLTFGELDGRK
ncbi:hypothetical protein T492DRAFT_918551, partial [Pavlovales sp. CCMP2436]